jgi:hypothetical protein
MHCTPPSRKSTCEQSSSRIHFPCIGTAPNRRAVPRLLASVRVLKPTGPLIPQACGSRLSRGRNRAACAPRRRAAAQRIARMGTDRSPRSSKSLLPRKHTASVHTRPAAALQMRNRPRPPAAARGAHHRRQRPWREEEEDPPTHSRALASARTRFMASQSTHTSGCTPTRKHGRHAHSRGVGGGRPRSPQAALRARCRRSQGKFVAWRFRALPSPGSAAYSSIRVGAPRGVAGQYMYPPHTGPHPPGDL